MLESGTVLSDFYNSACSGNIINRTKAIHACSKPLKSENWCHVERILQALVSSSGRTYAVKTSICTVTMKIEEDEWWTQDDELFLLNFLLHRQIIKTYHEEEALRVCQLPRFSDSKLLLFRAILFSKQVDYRASSTIRCQVDALIREDSVALVLNLAARDFTQKGHSSYIQVWR